MRTRSLICVVIGATLLAACTAASSGSANGEVSRAAQAAGEPSAPQSVARPVARPATSSLETLLTTFASPGGASWTAYQDVPGVQWQESSATEYAAGRYSRSGRARLEGYGAASLPTGRVGADAGVVNGNEGDSGVTLDGDATHVDTVSIKKFYPDENYLAVLKRQFADTATVSPLAEHCQLEDADDAETAFYKVDFGGSRPVYVETSLERGGQSGPGYTVFDFSRNDPSEHIKSLQCG